MKTHRRPSRGSTASAVRTRTFGPGDGASVARRCVIRHQRRGGDALATRRRGLAQWRPDRARRRAARTGRPAPRADRPRGAQVAARSSGRRKPIGESPGTRNRRPRRSCHASLTQPGRAGAVQRCTGSTKPAGSPRPRSNGRRMRARSRGSSILRIGRIDIVRQLVLLEHARDRILEGRLHVLGGDAEAAREAFGEALRGARPAADGRWLRARSSRHGARSARRPGANRARRPSAAAARPDTICPGRNAGARRARSDRAAGGSDRRRARAWSARARRCSIRPTDSRRSTRRSARRPW